jgi:ABC-type branched-subunit amino acid transport system ATPase component
LLPGGKGLAGSVVRKMQLARVFAHSPKLLVFNDFFNHLEKEEKGRLIDSVCSIGSPQSLLAFSTDGDLMKKCDRILILSNGAIIAEGNFAEIKSHPVMKRILND